MPRFTAEEWDDIEEARERLRQYKLRVQPYPELPHDATESATEPLEPWERPLPSTDQFQQLKAHVNYLQNKVNEHIDKSLKKRANVDPF